VTLVEEASDIQTLIEECVDSAFKELGQSVGKAIYFNLEKNFGIRKEDIPNQPEAFSEALHSIFGTGAKVIERIIVKEIQEKFRLRLKPETGFVEAVKAARKVTSGNSTIHNV